MRRFIGFASSVCVVVGRNRTKYMIDGGCEFLWGRRHNRRRRSTFSSGCGGLGHGSFLGTSSRTLFHRSFSYDQRCRYVCVVACFLGTHTPLACIACWQTVSLEFPVCRLSFYHTSQSFILNPNEIWNNETSTFSAKSCRPIKHINKHQT